jgi:hypothetical protein
MTEPAPDPALLRAKRFQLAVWLLIIFSIALFGFLAFIPTSWEERSGTTVLKILILKSWVPKALFIAGGITAFILFVCAMLCFVRRHILTGIAAFIAALGLPAAGFSFLMLNISPWYAVGETQSDGAEYFVLEQSFLQGQQMAMGKLEHKGRFFTHYTCLGITHFDSPRSYAALIFPSQPADSLKGALVQSSNGLILGLRGNDRCFLAYQPQSGKFLGYGDIEQLSPFVLLGPTDELNPTDVKQIDEALAGPGGFKRAGVPRKETLEEGLKHANPKVRELSEKWLKLYP